MSSFQQRTDLATESRTLAAAAIDAEEIDGVDYREYMLQNTPCQELIVVTEAGAKALGKPIGKYVTLNIGALLRREDDSFAHAVAAVADALKSLTGDLSADSPVLVVGLGNRDITPDAVGPQAAALTLVTRHLKQKMPVDFAGFAPVSVITPGVLGTSGIESFDYIKAVCQHVQPALVIAIDALAARQLERLCTTIQLSDAGISPGSGVGNARPEISKATLGVPVIAIGVPTVVDLRTVLADLPEFNQSTPSFDHSDSMVVTPRSIDTLVVSVSRAIAYGVNSALHSGLTVSDIDMLLC